MRQKMAALIKGAQSGWKQAARLVPPAPIDAHRLYRPKEVASILGVSYHTALRKMAAMRGVVDMGGKEKRFARRKRLLRISGARLL
jgi:hypothetical protein